MNLENPNRLLIVDDEQGIREFVKDAAEGIGFEVMQAGNYDEFCSCCLEFEPTALILDLVMPETDGVEMLRCLADHGCRAQIVVISGVDTKVLTSATRLGSTLDLRMLGSLQKPVLLPDLEVVLKKAMRGHRAVTKAELAKAIDCGELTVHYQPKIALKADGTGKSSAVEALVRWQHPEYGLLAPIEFLPLAEQAGLMSDLTDFVLETAIMQTSSWRDSGLAVSVAVNLAPQLLSNLKLPDRISALMTEAGLCPSALTLEITESAAMSDAAKNMDILTRLRLKGYGLSIDDFGTGYSSLVQLHRMPFNELKIDRSFVSEVGKSDEADIIVRSTVDLAHNLGLSVCAEGIETPEVLNYCQSLECESAQGFLWSKPLPAAQVSSFIKNAQKAEPHVTAARAVLPFTLSPRQEPRMMQAPA